MQLPAQQEPSVFLIRDLNDLTLGVATKQTAGRITDEIEGV